MKVTSTRLGFYILYIVTVRLSFYFSCFTYMGNTVMVSHSLGPSLWDMTSPMSVG